MAKQDNLISIQDINMGGLSNSKWSGQPNSVYKLVGFDIHSEPGIINVAQKLSKNSGSTVTELCKWQVASSNGRTYHFSSESGKIWERDSAGNWSLVYTTSPAAGEAKCLGAIEYQGYIYWATQSRLHRILATNAEGSSEWTANAAPNYATFTVTDASWHPMMEHPDQLILYIGDGNLLAQVNAGTFTANALDIKSPLRIKSLGRIGTDILLGTYVNDNITKTNLLRWNGWSVSFTTADEIDEVGINAFLPGDNVVFVQAGKAGNIYIYDGYKLNLWKKIPGVYSPTKYGEVYPNAVGNLEGQILFGFSNGTGNPADQGVYRLGRYSADYKYVMDMPYPISQRSSGELVTTSVEIGSVLVAGFNVFVSWKNGSSYGVDMLDYSNKLEKAYLESRVAVVKREVNTNVSKIFVPYVSMPSGTSIPISYSKNYGSYIATTPVVDTDRLIVNADMEGFSFNTIQVKLAPVVSGNDAPSFESIGIEIR